MYIAKTYCVNLAFGLLQQQREQALYMIVLESTLPWRLSLISRDLLIWKKSNNIKVLPVFNQRQDFYRAKKSLCKKRILIIKKINNSDTLYMLNVYGLLIYAVALHTSVWAHHSNSHASLLRLEKCLKDLREAYTPTELPRIKLEVELPTVKEVMQGIGVKRRKSKKPKELVTSHPKEVTLTPRFLIEAARHYHDLVFGRCFKPQEQETKLINMRTHETETKNRYELKGIFSTILKENGANSLNFVFALIDAWSTITSSIETVDREIYSNEGFVNWFVYHKNREKLKHLMWLHDYCNNGVPYKPKMEEWIDDKYKAISVVGTSTNGDRGKLSSE